MKNRKLVSLFAALTLMAATLSAPAPAYAAANLVADFKGAYSETQSYSTYPSLGYNTGYVTLGSNVAKAFDGNINTSWDVKSSSNVANRKIIFAVDFGTATTFNKVVIKWGSRKSPTNYNILSVNSDSNPYGAYEAATSLIGGAVPAASIATAMTHEFTAVTKRYLRFEIQPTAASQTYDIAEIEVYNDAVSTTKYAAAFFDANGNLLSEDGEGEFMDCDRFISVKITNPGLLGSTGYAIYGVSAFGAPVELDGGTLNLSSLEASKTVELDLSSAAAKTYTEISVKTTDGSEIGRLERNNDGFESNFVKGKFNSALQSGKSMAYRLYYPAGYDPDGNAVYPLVTYLHGTGSQGTDNLKPITMEKKGQPEYERSLMWQLTKNPANAAYNGFILVPQCPAGDVWASDGAWASGEYSVDAIAETSAMKVYLELLGAIGASESVDMSRLYITGFSMGGFGTFDAVARHPSLFAAAVPVAGGFDTSKAAALRDLPIRIYHNTGDPIVTPAGSQAMNAALTEVGGIVEYLEWTGATGGMYSHNSWQPTYAGYDAGGTGKGGTELYEWLFAQKKLGAGAFTVTNDSAGAGASAPEITASLTNNNPQARRATVIAAVYDENRRLIGISAKPNALYAAGVTPLTFAFANLRDASLIGCTYKIYVWRDLEDRRPVSLGAGGSAQ